MNKNSRISGMENKKLKEKINRQKAALASIIQLGFKGNWQTAQMVTKARQALEELENE